jgi:precorrin-6B C5,15-methyltransferase / cobalt-precorrin-6B C5,C15-methyltransferase
VTVTVIGVPVEGWAAGLEERMQLIRRADVVAVAPRLSEEVRGLVQEGASVLPIAGDMTGIIAAIEEAERAGKSVTVVASGDPGLFGIGRALAERLGHDAVLIRPSASSVAVAFGHLGLPWDDATVVSAHGRPLVAAVSALLGTQKAAVLTGPDVLPQLLGEALLAAGHEVEHVAVASNLGQPDERVERGDLEWLAGGSFSPLSVVLLWNGTGVAHEPALSAGGTVADRVRAFGRPESDFEHRDGMITKAEVRAACLARLELPPTGVLWDVGAGAGSLAIEAASLSPRLRVIAIERSAEEAERIGRNARRHGTAIEVVNDEAPGCLAGLPDPDRVFVGGGGLGVLDEVLGRLREGGRVVATYASVDRAVTAATRLGCLTQLSVSRGMTLPDGTWRLASLDPVFICWGRRPRSGGR